MERFNGDGIGIGFDFDPDGFYDTAFENGDGGEPIARRISQEEMDEILSNYGDGFGNGDWNNHS